MNSDLHSNTTRTINIALVAVFLVIITIEGPVQAVLDWRNEGRPQILDLLNETPTQAHLRAFETTLEDNAWSARAIRPGMQYLRYRTLGDLGAKALAGNDGWLFYRPGVDFLVQPWSGAGEGAPVDPLPAITAFRDELQARGVELLVVVAPGKASIYPDRLSPRMNEGAGDVSRHTHAFQERLAEAGVPFVDLHAAFAAARSDADAPPLYLARDTHWSPEGLRIAAAAVADRIRAEGWVMPGATDYQEQRVEVAREGDVLRMTESDWLEALYPPESAVCASVVDTATGEMYRDHEDSPVLVLGDSFLRIYQQDAPGSAGFIAHLARELKQPLASIVSDGGASTLVRQELSRRPELLRGKSLVIWEFVERDLRFGTEGWQQVSLPR
jgi:hypothetical protein